MKPITFENLRRLMGGGRKKKEKDKSSFKRSDSFKRISIRRSYLDRGKKKVIPKLEVATQTVSEADFLAQIPEEIVRKVDSSVQVDKVDLNATIKSGKEVFCNRKQKFPETKNVSDDSVVVYSQWLQEIKRDEPPASRHIKGSERTIIYVPASDEKVQVPVIRQLSSSPIFRKNNTSSTHITHTSTSNLQRKESNDSAVEMFPWGDSTDVKKSPLIRRRSRQSPIPLLPTDSGAEELCSLSISLGRIWMDAPQAMAPRSLEMPKPSSSNPPPVHHSLDSALKDLRDDPMVSNRLQKRSTPPVTRTLSSTSNNTNSTGLFSSKDSGFSFSISAPKLSDFHANFSPNGSKGGFFRKKSKPKPKLSVSRDGYFKRTSSAILLEGRKNSVRRSTKKKKNKSKKSKKKDKDSGTIRSDIYQVICSRPQRAIASLKLDPMIFVPPEKRKAGSQKPSFKTKMQEIRNFNPLDSSMYSTTRSLDSTDEGLYESLPGDYEYLTDDEEINLESFSMERKELTEVNGSSKELLEVQHQVNVTSGYGVVRKFCNNETTDYTRFNERKDTRYVQNGDSRYGCGGRKDPLEIRKHQKRRTEVFNYQRTQYTRSKDFRYSYREPANDLEDFSEEDSLVSILSDNCSDSDLEGQCVNVYVPPGVSPVPRRRPVRRKKSSGLNHKRSITYLVKPTVIRAPSTLRRPTKKIGKRPKQSKPKDPHSNDSSYSEYNSHELT